MDHAALPSGGEGVRAAVQEARNARSIQCEEWNSQVNIWFRGGAPTLKGVTNLPKNFGNFRAIGKIKKLWGK